MAVDRLIHRSGVVDSVVMLLLVGLIDLVGILLRLVRSLLRVLIEHGGFGTGVDLVDRAAVVDDGRRESRVLGLQALRSP